MSGETKCAKLVGGEIVCGEPKDSPVHDCLPSGWGIYSHPFEPAPQAAEGQKGNLIVKYATQAELDARAAKVIADEYPLVVPTLCTQDLPFTNRDFTAELAEIEARAEKATEGPWIVENRPAFILLDLDETLNGASLRVSAKACVSKYGLIPQGVLWPADADFIAHARIDIPRLLAIIRQITGGGA